MSLDIEAPTNGVLSPLYTIPPELVDIICTFLPYSAVLALKLASRHLYLNVVLPHTKLSELNSCARFSVIRHLQTLRTITKPALEPAQQPSLPPSNLSIQPPPYPPYHSRLHASLVPVPPESRTDLHYGSFHLGACSAKSSCLAQAIIPPTLLDSSTNHLQEPEPEPRQRCRLCKSTYPSSMFAPQATGIGKLLPPGVCVWHVGRLLRVARTRSSIPVSTTTTVVNPPTEQSKIGADIPCEAIGGPLNARPGLSRNDSGVALLAEKEEVQQEKQGNQGITAACTFDAFGKFAGDILVDGPVGLQVISGNPRTPSPTTPAQRNAPPAGKEKRKRTSMSIVNNNPHWLSEQSTLCLHCGAVLGWKPCDCACEDCGVQETRAFTRLLEPLAISSSTTTGGEGGRREEGVVHKMGVAGPWGADVWESRNLWILAERELGL